jgi:hypothetical protein
MIEILQWSTLIACAAAAAWRVPSFLRKSNRSLFYIFLCMSLAILLSIKGPYVAIDGLLGGMNVANLFLRFLIFGTIYFMGVRIAQGFGDTRGLKLIRGRTGFVVLVLVSVALLVLFAQMDAQGSSAGMAAVSVKDERNAMLVEYYGSAGRVYPAFVSLAIVPGLLRAVRGSLPGLLRISAMLLAIGGVSVAASVLFPLIPRSLEHVEFIINYTAILCFVLGFALIWLAKGLEAHRHGRGTVKVAAIR